MTSILNIFHSEHFIALFIAFFVFLTTILLIVKKRIGFSATLVLLTFSLTAGLIINNQEELQSYLISPSSSANSGEVSEEDFQKQILQAMENLKMEVTAEKENLRHVMDQVQDVFNSVDGQKQKLQNFIEEVRHNFKNDNPENKVNNSSSREKFFRSE